MDDAATAQQLVTGLLQLQASGGGDTGLIASVTELDLGQSPDSYQFSAHLSGYLMSARPHVAQAG